MRKRGRRKPERERERGIPAVAETCRRGPPAPGNRHEANNTLVHKKLKEVLQTGCM